MADQGTLYQSFLVQRRYLYKYGLNVVTGRGGVILPIFWLGPLPPLIFLKSDVS